MDCKILRQPQLTVVIIVVAKKKNREEINFKTNNFQFGVMVNVALVFSLFVYWFAGILPLPKEDYRWYKRTMRYCDHLDKRGKKKSWWRCGEKKLPCIPRWVLEAIRVLVFTMVVAAVYYYFDGNCRFNKFRIFDEDDELGSGDYDRGLVVMLFLMVECVLYYVWRWVFFRWRITSLALLVSLFALAVTVVVLWAMATTETCPRDEFRNRFWMCFGLYLFNTLFWLFKFCITARWTCVVGGRANRNGTLWMASKNHRRTRKELKPYHVEKYQRILNQHAVLVKSDAAEEDLAIQRRKEYEDVNERSGRGGGDVNGGGREYLSVPSYSTRPATSNQHSNNYQQQQQQQQQHGNYTDTYVVSLDLPSNYSNVGGY